MKGKEVWVLMIRNLNDVVSDPVPMVFRSERGAMEYLHQYVKEEWDGDDPLPKDRGRAIERYFDEVADYKWYWLSEQEVL